MFLKHTTKTHRLREIFLFVGALIVLPLAAFADTQLGKLVGRYSKQQVIALDVGQTHSFRLHNGSQRAIRLISARETRDRVIGLVRRAEIKVEIDAKPLRLACAPYVMPTEIEGLRIQADTTSGWSRIPKRVQFSVWDATDPIVNTDRFRFPIRDYALFSHGTQGYNEAVHLGLGDGDPQGQKFCHDYGFDMAGYEGRDVITSCTDGEVILLWPREGRPWSVVIQDKQGFAWDYGHLDSISPNVEAGASIRRGQTIGILGKTGPSGNFSHLHLGVYLSTADARQRRSSRRFNLYPWLMAASRRQSGRELVAVARPHQTVTTGEKVVFDGSHSVAWDAEITSYRWQLPDGGVVDRGRAETVFDKPGLYVATLRVKDDKGREDVDFCKVKVFTKDAPQKGIPTIFMTHHPATNVAVGQAVHFRMWLQAGQPGPFRVDFGDGTAIDEYVSYSEITHKFKTPGIHLVTARAEFAGMPITQRQKVIVGDSASDEP